MTEITFPNRRKVSDETAGEIRKNFREGMTIADIAWVFGISANTVSRICSPCREHKPPPKKTKPVGRSGRHTNVPDETIRDVLTLLDTNKYSETEIAEKLGVSFGVIKRVRGGGLVPESEECPKCGRVTVLPCLACRLKQRRVPVYDLPYRLELELAPQDFARYLEVSQEQNAMRDQKELWDEYTRVRSIDARNAIVSAYTSVARKIARQVKKKVPGHIDEEELFSSGVVGLIQAVEKFDPARNDNFPSYAQLRIRGAIIDGFRDTDWVSRSHRELLKEFERTQEDLTQTLGKIPTFNETIEAMPVGKQKKQELTTSPDPTMESLQKPIFEGNAGQIVTLLERLSVKTDDKSNSRAEVLAEEIIARSGLNAQEKDVVNGDFAIDLESAIIPEKIIVDYNHDNQLILGFADGMTVEGETLTGRGVLISRNDPAEKGETDRLVDKIATDLREGVPYEASITFSHEYLETSVVDNTTYLKKINLRGVSICPFGEDDGTEVSLLALQQKATEMSIQTKDKHEKRTLTTMTKRVIDNENPGDTEEKPAPDPTREEVQQYIDEFGLEAGTRFWLDGTKFEEAKEARYQEMKSKLADAGDAAPPDDEEEKKPDETQMSAKNGTLTLLAKTVENQGKLIESVLKTQNAILTKLSAAGADPVEVSGGKQESEKSARKAYIEELNNLKI